MTAFPAERPPLLDAPDSIRAHDWQAYRQLAAMENHWQRPGWHPGRRSYHWLLTFHDTDGVRQLAARCQAQLDRSELDPVPLDGLHLTLGRLGFTDELPTATVDNAAAAARPACAQLDPFPLSIGPLAGSTGALRFTVAPWTGLVGLHRRLTSATRAALGTACVMDTSRFRPHLSIAYANAPLPTASLLPVLERLRTLPPHNVTIGSVQLVELRRESRSYRFDTVHTLTLGEECASYCVRPG